MRWPTPSIAISIFSMLIALGGASYAATGGNFLLGKPNSAAHATSLTSQVAGRALQISNQVSTTTSTALSLTVAAGRPPMMVNSKTKVANLNADLLDGLDATQFARVRTVPFSLAANGVSAPIPLPPNVPVIILGMTTTDQHQGLGLVAAVGVPNPNGLLAWTGQESPYGGEDTSGESPTVGAHIAYLNWNHWVDLEVGGVSAVQVHNENTDHETGFLKIMW